MHLVCCGLQWQLVVAYTKLWSRLGDPFLSRIYHLVVTVGHNKSYAGSGCKKCTWLSVVGPLGKAKVSQVCGGNYPHREG